MSIIQRVSNAEQVLWTNTHKLPAASAAFPITKAQILEGEERLERFRPFIAGAFDDCPDGIVESRLADIPSMQIALINGGSEIKGRLMLKLDSHLPIAGSVKARGGVYEVLKHGETLALKNGIISPGEDYSALLNKKDFFSRYTIQVGSTGNLGLSIGITGAALGFKVIVHMSADARQWKKDLLRSKGVQVIEYAQDYGKAVEQGRLSSDADLMSYFVDDENSVDLFIGYAVAAGRLSRQLEEKSILVDINHPLFVYIPCGVGGAPGGVAYGLKQIYGDNVHCFFVEPTQCPCMLLGMATGKHNGVCVQDFGLTGHTEADGLAVGRPSGFVGRTMENLLSGVFTVEDKRLFSWLRMLDVEEGLRIEPSACAAFAGPADLMKYPEGREYCSGLNMDGATHICWATGGRLVPEEIMEQYLTLYMEG